MSQNESPVILLPSNQARLARLKDKLTEYRRRLDAFKPPEQQIGTWMKIEVLEKLLTEGAVKTWDFSRELAEKYRSSFSPYDFANACAVIEDYSKTGGANTSGGTGLDK